MTWIYFKPRRKSVNHQRICDEDIDLDILDAENEYTPEFIQAFESNEESRLHKIFDQSDWRRHLNGYRLKDNNDGTKSIVSTPLLDLIAKNPLFTGKIFYKMMSIETKANDKPVSFEDFDVSVLNQAKAVKLDYSYFDNIPTIKDWIRSGSFSIPELQ